MIKHITVLACLLTFLSQGISQADRINQMSDSILSSALKNTTGILGGDVPQAILIDQTPGSAKILQIKWSDNPSTPEQSGFIAIPTGVIADIKQTKVRFRVVEMTGSPTLAISVLYNTLEHYDPAYTGESGLASFSKTFAPNDFTVGHVIDTVITNARWNGAKSSYGDAIRFEFSGAASSITVALESAEFVDSSGKSTSLYDIDWSFRGYALPPVIPKTTPMSGQHVVYIGTSTTELMSPKGRNQILTLKGILPNLGVNCNSYLPALVAEKEWLSKHNIPFVYQVGGIFDLEPYVSEKQAHAVDWTGKSSDTDPRGSSAFHEMDWCNPAIADGFSEAIRRVGLGGIPEFQFIDCVWPYWGQYGYSEADVKAYRDALQGLDNGLKIGKLGTKSPKTMTFLEYVKDAAGVALNPHELGLSSWSQYLPCLNGFSTNEQHDALKKRTGATFSSKNFFIHLMLVHYGYLKLVDTIGSAGQASGTSLTIMPNGDNWQNGNDYLGLMRLSNVKTLIDETHFYHPGNIARSYKSLPVWRQMAAKYGKHHRLIGESGLGGGGPAYLAPEFAYIFWYALNAAGHYDSMQNDWICGNTNSQSNEYEFRRYVDFLSKAFGYNDSTSDSPEHLSGYDKAILVGRSQPFWISYNNKNTLEKALDKTSYPWIAMDYRSCNDLKALDKARVVLCEASALPQYFAADLVSAAKKNAMSIVMYGSSVGNKMDATNYTDIWWDGTSINSPDFFADFVGSVSSGAMQDIKGDAVVSSTGEKIGFSYSGQLYQISASARPLVSSGNTPLASVVELKNGSKIYYLHFSPGNDGTLGIEKYVLWKVFKDRAITADGKESNCYLQRYKTANGEVAALFSRKSLEDYKGPFAPNDVPYTYNMPGSHSTAQFTTTVKPPFVIYDFMSGKKLGNHTSAQVTLELNLKTAGLFYIVPSAKSKTMELELKKRHAKLQYWLDIIEAEFNPKTQPSSLKEAAIGKPGDSLFLTWSANMEPYNKGNTDGTTLSFYSEDNTGKSLRLIGRHNLANAFEVSSPLALPLGAKMPGRIILSVTCNSNPAFDSTVIHSLQVVRADGSLVADLIKNSRLPVFHREMQFGRLFDANAEHIKATGATFDATSSDTLSIHPGYTGQGGGSCGVWNMAQVK